MSKELNEPAFPVTACVDHEFVGMTLRDYFAAKAMQALIANECAVQRHKEVAAIEGFNPEVLLATGAYMFADAMLAERAK